MFADQDAMRAKAHENIDKKDYDVADLYHTEGIAQAIARNGKFASLTLAVIGLNAFWIGLDAECNNTDDNRIDNGGCRFTSEDKDFWNVGEHLFCGFFTIELLTRFAAFKSKWSGLRDNWFRFDSVLVFFMVLETWIIPLSLALSTSTQDSSGLDDFALLKILRLFRLTRMVRLMRSVPELVTLLKGMVIAARSVCYTLLLLLMILYIFSIIFKSQLVDTPVPDLKGHFSNILRSMWTLFLAGCLLDDISKIGDLLVQHNLFMAFIFIFFVLLSSLMVLNMLIGVLCAVVTAVAAAEKEKALVNYVKSKLFSVLHRLDEDGNGTICKGEFDQLVNIPEAVSALNELGVDVPNLMSLADFLFEVDETDGPSERNPLSTSSVATSRGVDDRKTASSANEADKPEDEGKSMTFAEFLEMVIRLRSENQPSVADVVELRKLIFKGQRQVQRRVDKIERSQEDLERVVHHVHSQLDAALHLAEEFAQASDMAPELQALITRARKSDEKVGADAWDRSQDKHGEQTFGQPGGDREPEPDNRA